MNENAPLCAAIRQQKITMCVRACDVCVVLFWRLGARGASVSGAFNF